jgi:hypothetical protein
MTMQTVKTAVEQFLQNYADLSDRGDVSGLVACFADVFVAGGPQGAQGVRAGDFALALPKRYEMFARMGCRKTELIGIEETRIDARYVWVRTWWRLTFERPEREPMLLDVESTYLIDAGVEPMRFLVYLAHQDIFEKLKELGIAA